MKLKLFLGMLICFFCNTYFLNAQTQASTNINAQPIWGPVGYDYVENYYMPEIESYYNVHSKMFMYMIDGKWLTSSKLPSRYNKYDLYHGYKVIINEQNPYLHFNKHRTKFISFWNKRNQEPIRDSREVKYFANSNHPMHNEWKNARNKINSSNSKIIKANVKN